MGVHASEQVVAVDARVEHELSRQVLVPHGDAPVKHEHAVAVGVATDHDVVGLDVDDEPALGVNRLQRPQLSRRTRVPFT